MVAPEVRAYAGGRARGNYCHRGLIGRVGPAQSEGLLIRRQDFVVRCAFLHPIRG